VLQEGACNPGEGAPHPLWREFGGVGTGGVPPRCGDRDAARREGSRGAGEGSGSVGRARKVGWGSSALSFSSMSKRARDVQSSSLNGPCPSGG